MNICIITKTAWSFSAAVLLLLPSVAMAQSAETGLMQSVLSDRNKKVAVQQEEVQGLRQQLKESKAALVKLRSQNARIRGQISEVKMELASEESALQSSQRELVALQEQQQSKSQVVASEVKKTELVIASAREAARVESMEQDAELAETESRERAAFRAREGALAEAKEGQARDMAALQARERELTESQARDIAALRARERKLIEAQAAEIAALRAREAEMIAAQDRGGSAAEISGVTEAGSAKGKSQVGQNEQTVEIATEGESLSDGSLSENQDGEAENEEEGVASEAGNFVKDTVVDQTKSTAKRATKKVIKDLLSF